MRRGDIHRLGAFLLRLVGEREQRADIMGRKAEAARVADEPEPLQMQMCELPAARCAAFGRREQTDLFVEADHVHIRTDATPKLAAANEHRTSTRLNSSHYCDIRMLSSSLKQTHEQTT